MCFFALNRENRVSLQPSTFNPLIFALPWNGNNGSLTQQDGFDMNELRQKNRSWAEGISAKGMKDDERRDQNSKGVRSLRIFEHLDFGGSIIFFALWIFLGHFGFVSQSSQQPGNPRCTTWAAARDAIVAAPPAASLECLEAGQAAQCCQRAGAGRTGHGGHDWGCFIYHNISQPQKWW